jgi:hypothetical protein
MKTAIIALSAAALLATPPAAFAQALAGKTPASHHKVARKPHQNVSVYAPMREMQARAPRRGYPAAFGYAPNESIDRDLEMSRQAGGGGGGGGAGGM